MGHKMNMQFTWQGCDSILAAPLIVDLIRFMNLAQKRNIGGIVDPLSIYFKHPIGLDNSNINSNYSATLQTA